MHMADALLSPAVGGIMWAGAAGAIAFSSAKLRKEVDDRKVPLMGVLGAFLFAAQMINFSIPGTGSSGHLSGGLLLAVLLGPHAAFLTIASVLVVQALFFADGGLLALGCNIFNLGFIPAFLVFPLCYRKLAGDRPGGTRISVATMLSAVLALQLGSFAVVLETVASGVSSLPFGAFSLLMQPIHLAIGVMEGAATIAILSFVRKARPELLQIQTETEPSPAGRSPFGKLVGGFLGCALLISALFSLYGSEQPDGLEWAIAGAAGGEGVAAAPDSVHGVLTSLQQKAAWFPEYGFRSAAGSAEPGQAAAASPDGSTKLGTSVAGIVGTLVTLLCSFCLAFMLKRRNHGAGQQF